MMLTSLQEALDHPWLSGMNATDHNLLPEIRAYMAKARLRRGIEIIKLANRIEALKMHDDEDTEGSGDSDVPADPHAAANNAVTGDPGDDQGSGEGRPRSESSGKKSLGAIAKGAIFKEVVMAKVREMKEAEQAKAIEAEAMEQDAKRKQSFQQ